MLSIYYLIRDRYSSTRAHLHNIVKTCESLEQTNQVRLTLVNADEGLKDKKAINDFFKQHQVAREFNIISLNSLANRFKFKGSRLTTLLEIIFSNLNLIKFLTKKRKDFQLVYFRDHLLLPTVLFARYFLGKKVFFESHYIMNHWYSRFLTNWAIAISQGVIAISQALVKRLKKYNRNMIDLFCAAPDFSGEDFSKYNQKEIRKELSLPADKMIIGYTGNMWISGLGDSYGLEEVVKSLKHLPDNFVFVGVGDRVGEAQFLNKLAEQDGVKERVMILPWAERGLIPKYLAAFDILIIPKSGGAPGNAPTKIYEYLLTGKPIVACATETILESLHDEKNCLIVKDNSPKEWAEKIKRIFEDKELPARLISQAKKDAPFYTWQNRGHLLLDFIKESLNLRSKFKNFLLNLVYYSGFNWRYNFFSPRKLFLIGGHSVSSEENQKALQNIFYYRLSIDKNFLEEQIKYLLKNKYTFFTFNELLKNNCALPKKSVVMYFDDGFRDVYLNAYPVFKKYNLPFVLFVTTDLIDQKRLMPSMEKCRRQITERIFLNWPEVKGMSDLAEINSHGASHRDFVDLSEDELKKELKISKQKIKEETGQEPIALSYPHGKYNQRIKELVKEAGYQFAVSTKIGQSDIREKFDLKKVVIYPTDNMTIFKLKMGIFHKLRNLIG